MEFYQIFKFQGTQHQRKSPYWRLSGDGSGSAFKDGNYFHM